MINTLESLLRVIEAALPSMTWTEPRDIGPGTALMREGRSAEARMIITVVEFDLEDQGFPPGSKGYDGAVAISSDIVRLTRELAEKAFKFSKGA